MKRTLYLLSLLTLAACSNDDNAVPETNVDRTEITFSSNLNTEVSSQPMTRALTEDGFGQQTRIVMRIKSEDKSTPANIKFTRTKAFSTEKAGGKSAVLFDSGDKRYWDDAHGRNSQLSVYAVAIENDATNLSEDKLTGGSGTETWFTEATENENIEWTVSTAQTTPDINKENLVYSNNIQNNGTDDRLKFIEYVGGTGHGTFAQGELKFNHALTRITVALTRGEGFNSGFSSVSGVINSAPYKGKLNLINGTWTNVESQQITMASTGTQNTYQAQILPGLQLTDGSSNNILEFTIDGNVYYVTSDMLYDKLASATSGGGENALDGGKLKPGMNYAINLTVKKTGVQVSAKVVAWDNVSISEELSNNYIQLSFHDFGGTACDKEKIKLYYCTQDVGTPSISDPDNLFGWDQTYTGPVELANTDETNVYKATSLYFESNTKFYHFRTTTESSLASGAKTFSISSGFTEAADAKDPHWGAPIKGSEKPKYNPSDADASKKGFGEYIHSAIGSTSSTIAITEFHMLSNVIIKLTTPNDDSGVTLTDATVKLLKIAEEGTVDMGSGFITPSAIQDTYEVLAKSGGTNEYFSPIVPQALKRSDASTVGVEITTTDGNVYKLDDISTFTAKTVSEGAANHTLNGAVARWYPNTQYTYTFTLKKTGIDKITCTVTEWDEVTVNGGDITIQ